MNPELAWMVAIFWIGRKPRCEVSMASASPDCPNGVRGSHLAIFPDIGTHSSGLLALNARPSNVLRSRGWRLRPQFRDEPQNLLEHLPWDGDLGHLEGDIAAVAHDFAPILISFSFKLVSDQSLIGPGVASGRKKLPRL